VKVTDVGKNVENETRIFNTRYGLIQGFNVSSRRRERRGAIAALAGIGVFMSAA